MEPLRERVLCLRCLRPQTTCYCKTVKPFRAEPQIVLLQHPAEQRNGIGTARMTHHCITNSKLIFGCQFEDNSDVNELIHEPDHHCVVLYPSKRSLNLSSKTLPEIQASFPHDKKLVVFIIDGTWYSAKKMINHSPNLAALPHISFIPKQASEYKIRRQPAEQCVSTIEAVHQILAMLEPKLDASNLLDVFRGMVEKQVYYAEHKNQVRVVMNKRIKTAEIQA